MISHTFRDGRGIVKFNHIITEVGNWLAYTSITNVYFSDRVTAIGKSAFVNCPFLALTSLPNSITYIGQNAFAFGKSLALTSLPDGITYIGYSAFGACDALALTSLPQSLTLIDGEAFSNCKSLAIQSLPHGVTSIEWRAFFNCIGIQRLTVPISTPPQLSSAAFDNTTFPIYVPESSFNAYQTASGWKFYASRIRPYV
ncbi:MAG: leucine-rich repeat domain-containing protein [Bacteroidales bacterium]|nr:leucine-rich repeat domain-containing protein [Candidatus Egerieousia equi]